MKQATELTLHNSGNAHLPSLKFMDKKWGDLRKHSLSGYRETENRKTFCALGLYNLYIFVPMGIFVLNCCIFYQQNCEALFDRRSMRVHCDHIHQ